MDLSIESIVFPFFILLKMTPGGGDVTKDLRRFCYYSIGLVNYLTILFTLVLLAATNLKIVTHCENSLTLPFVMLGAVLILFSLISLIDHLCSRGGAPRWSFRIFMRVLLASIVLHVIITVSLYVFTRDVAWMRRTFVEDSNRWNTTVKPCLIRHNVCDEKTYPCVMPRSSIQSGCCKPPDECNFEYVSPVEWIKAPSVNSTMNHHDCQLWRNDADGFCFDCDSCKDEFVHNLKHVWGYRSFIYIFESLLMLLLYYIGSLTLKYYPTPAREKKD